MQQTENNNCPVSPQNQQSTNNDEINLLDLLLVLAKHWKMIVVVPFVVAVITAIYTLTMPNIYTAKTVIIPSDNDSGGISSLMGQLGGLAAMAGGSFGGKNTSEQYVTMINSETLQDPIIDKFKLIDHYKAKLRSDVYRTLDSVVNASLGKKDGTITISFSDEDPKFAADLANEYVDQLSKLAIQLDVTGASDNRKFLEKRIAEVRAELIKAEDDLKNFQITNKVISVTDQAKATIEAVAQMRTQLAAQEIQLRTLRQSFTNNSNEVKVVTSTIASLRAQIASLEGQGMRSSAIPNFGSVPQLGQEYLRLMREFKIQEAMLEILTKQYEVAKLSEAKDTSPFQVLEKAKVQERKSKPRRSQIVIMTAIATAFMMVPLAFVIDYSKKMNDRDRQRWQEMRRLLPLPRRFKMRSK